MQVLDRDKLLDLIGSQADWAHDVATGKITVATTNPEPDPHFAARHEAYGAWWTMAFDLIAKFPPVGSKTCLHCGTIFSPKSSKAVYCGSRCRRNAHYARHRHEGRNGNLDL